MKLTSMTDFVLEQEKLNQKNTSRLACLCANYANFLKQPLTLGMFIPCDEDGNILEEPSKKDMEWFKGLAYGDFSCDYTRIFEFIEAKERVLFEFDGDLSLIRNVTNFYIIEDKNGVYLRVLKNKTKTTIESLLKFSVEITLTETALKQIGL